jgi:lysyl oxidase-like protein 2/3/4
MSVTWGDIYGAGTSCQHIDITHVPSGTYTLEVVINPEPVIGESNHANNIGRVSVSF